MFLIHVHYLGSETTRKSSLTPPSEPDLSWQNYINSSAGEPPCLGREHLCKESRKTFKATVAMSEEFPLTVEMLLSVLEVKICLPRFHHSSNINYKNTVRITSAYNYFILGNCTAVQALSKTS